MRSASAACVNPAAIRSRRTFRPTIRRTAGFCRRDTGHASGRAFHCHRSIHRRCPRRSGDRTTLRMTALLAPFGSSDLHSIRILFNSAGCVRGYAHIAEKQRKTNF